MGKHEIVKEQLLHIVLIPFRKSGWENYSLSESNYMTSVLIPFRKSGWENAESSWPMRSVVCLNPLQEIGVGKQEPIQRKQIGNVLIPFRKSGWENDKDKHHHA